MAARSAGSGRGYIGSKPRFHRQRSFLAEHRPLAAEPPREMLALERTFLVVTLDRRVGDRDHRWIGVEVAFDQSRFAQARLQEAVALPSEGPRAEIGR